MMMNTTNFSQPVDSADPRASFEYLMHVYVLPIIVFVGLFGNCTLIFLISADKQMRNVSSSVYLASVLAADTGMLLSLFLTWLETLGFPLNHKPVICRINVYMTYVCGFLSIWYVVCITVETFITICHPTRIKQMCTLFRARVVTVVLLVTALLMYIISPIITKVQTIYYPTYNRSMEICSAMPEYAQYNYIVSYIDTVFTLLVPMLVMIILLTLMTIAIMHSIQRKQKRTITKKNADSNGNTSSSTRNLPQVRVAKMLYTLSLSVVILNAPSHGFRLKVMFSGTQYMPSLEARVLMILLFVSYCSFSVKFFICLIFSKNFRKLLKNQFCCNRFRRYQSVPQQTMETAT